MVILRPCALALVAGGCLSKPALPVDGGPGPSDAQDAQDGSMLTDAAPACLGRTPLPSGTVLRDNVEVLDLDRRDGANADDIIVWGRETSGQAYAYILSGHPQMTGTCYDRRVPFLNPSEVDPLDVFVGEITGDAHPDLLLLGVETQQSDPRHEIILYPGDPTALVAATPTSIRLPFNPGFQGPWGGTPANPAPAFVLGWKQTLQPQLHVFAGGVYWHPATITLNPNPLNFASGVPATLAGVDVPITMAAVQEVAVHTVPDPDEMVFVVSNDVFRVRYVEDGSGHTFELGGTTPLGPPGMRYARFARRPVDLGGVQTTLGVTQHGTAGYQLMRIGGPFATAPTVDHFPTPTPPQDQLDLAIGFTNAGAVPDLVALVVDASPGTLLRVHIDINFQQSPVGATTIREIRLDDTGTDRYTIVAVGDFDGTGGQPDQIIVMSTQPAALPAKCFVLDGTLVPCP